MFARGRFHATNNSECLPITVPLNPCLKPLRQIEGVRRKEREREREREREKERERDRERERERAREMG